MSATTPPDAARRSERARTAILAAARDLLSELGYQKLTIEGIAARAGVGKQTIYRWWPSKAAVVVDSFLESAAGRNATTIAHTPHLEDDIRSYAHRFHAELNQPGFGALARILTIDMLREDTEGPSIVDRIIRDRRAPLLERLAAAQENGEISPGVDLDVAADLLAGPIYFRWLLSAKPLTVESVDAVVSLTVKALHAEP